MDNRAEQVRKRKDPPGFPYLLIGRSYKKRTENNTSGTSGKNHQEKNFLEEKDIGFHIRKAHQKLSQVNEDRPRSVCWGERDKPASLQREG